MKYDYIIVGQGIAGTVLSYLLMKANKRIAIIDEYDAGTASRVAVGLFNPFTGRKVVKTWNADNLFPFIHQFYKGLEVDLGSTFFYPKDIYRPFKSMEEQNDWMGSVMENRYDHFIKKVYTKPVFTDEVINPYGGVELNMGGYVVVENMLDAARTYFHKHATIFEDNFDYGKIEYSEYNIVYKNIEARNIIFCDGHAAGKRGFFTWLPFRPVKGEVLYLESSKEIERIYNRGCFITPKINGLHRCGSTYNRKELSRTPTTDGKEKILENLKGLINWETKIKDHRAGIRPASADRRPLIGFHPERKKFIIFNGLGTKGVSLAPYYADQLVKCLIEGKIVDKEVNIERYYSLYYDSCSTKKV